ncbi:CLUMA_CG010345, isoform A [Clunio marinus]|uniref:Signal recognition particle subunit SRP68 n=1 Tax=Clunio marinus TaxID=568069 RepID=A0A1J1IBL8_9DIPT|nr:CLUMA_CG010345, isoform A [Clunio marinus]
MDSKVSLNDKENVNPESNVQATAAPKIYTVEILKLIKEMQQQHGLRHGDFQRYRGYCTRRVKRLRKALNIPQGDRRHFKKKEVTTGHLEGKNSSEKFIQIPLMLAERAWAYAMQLRQEANSEPRKKFHLISKMRKACVYSLQLQTLICSEFCDARSKLEAEAYNAWIHGTFHFEISEWKEAAENLKKSQLVYENLLQALPEEEQGIYKAKIEELNPSLRYCAYNIGESANMNDLMEMRGQGLLDNLGALVAQTKTEQTDAFQATEWRGRKVTVRPQKVRLFLLSIQDLDKSVEKAKEHQAKIDILENALLDCKDAISALKDEIKQDPKLRVPTSDGQISGIQYLLTYLSYSRLKMTLERNLCLVAQSKQSMKESTEKSNEGGKRVRPQDISRLYEIILQNITELQQLNGLESDADYQKEMETLGQAFKAFRCYYIAITLVNLKRWKEAVSMYERSTKYASEAIKFKVKEFNLSDELKALIKKIEGSKFSAHAYSVLETDGQEETVLYGKAQKSSKPLFERLDQYKEDQTLNSRNPNVYKLTPEMEAIPCKPLFFDLALNFIEFPSLEDKVESPGKKSGAPGAGISGFVKGFLGWGGEKK